MYKKAIEIFPKQPNAYQLLGNLYTNLGRIEEGMDEYKKVLHFAQNDAQTYVLLGNAHYLNNEIEKAIGSYKAAIDIQPENDEFKLVYYQIMDEYIDTKRKEMEA